MAKEQDQERTQDHTTDVNEIEPGMEVKDKENLLGDSDLSKPRVDEVIRDKKGQVEGLLVHKGLFFKKKVVIPVDRIVGVEKKPEQGKDAGEVFVDTIPQDEAVLAKRGPETLPNEQEKDAGSQAQEKETEEQQKKLTARPRFLQMLRILGPGFLTGMSGNDATAVTTYAIDGATAGYGQLWLMLLTTPMYQAVEYACAKIGRTTKMGLDDVLRTHYKRWVAVFASLVLLVANIALIAGNLVAIGSGLQLITGISWVWFEIPVAAVLWFIIVFSNFKMIKNIFIIMSAAFIGYVVTAFVSGADWKAVLIASFVPHINFNFNDISAALALLGATISPYSMYWQVSAEVEQKRVGTMRQQYRKAGLDVASGTVGGNLVSYFIIITTASTLFIHHQSIQTAANAANALGPLVGPFAKYLFAIGLIGAGVISIPVIAASTADAIADTFGWPAGLSDKPWQAEGFYLVLSFAMLISLLLALLRLDPIKLIFYANILVAVLAPILVIFIMVIANARKVMGKHRVGWLTNIFLGLTALVLIAGTILFFYGLFTGQGGS